MHKRLLRSADAARESPGVGQPRQKDPALAERVAHDAPNAVRKHYDADHFTVYHPPVVEKAAADQAGSRIAHLTQ